MSAITYSIDGIPFKEYGVYVASSSGLIDRPKLKKSLSTSWDDYHGISIDLNNKFYEHRDISLECFILASNKLEFVQKVSTFQEVFNKKGTQRLAVYIDEEKPLIYEVFCEENINIEKKWDEKKMAGTFSLNLKEPEPVKKVLKFTASEENNLTCDIEFSSSKLINIYWGDNSSLLDLYGEEKNISHSYEKSGNYFILITGDIDAISLLSSNAYTIWNKL